MRSGKSAVRTDNITAKRVMRRGKSAVRTDNITAVRTDNITAKRNKEKQTKQWFTKHYTEK
jgi:hypothetical protein